MVFKLAFRSILRNRRRTAVSLAVIGLGTAALFLANGYVAFTYSGLEQMSVEQTGHLQVARPEVWTETGEGERHLLDRRQQETLARILGELPEVVAYGGTLSLAGIIGTDRQSTAFVAEGIDPAFAFTPWMLEEGTKLFPGDRERILLGRGMARALGAKPEDWLSLLCTTVEGAYNAASVQVSGTFSTGTAQGDARLAVLPLSFAQSLLNTDGIEKLIVKLDRTEATDRVAAELARRLKAAGLPLQVKTWRELSVFFKQVRTMYGAIFGFMTITIFGLVSFSVLEVMTLAFFERMRELGTAMAIGTSRGQIFAQLLSEGLLLGVFGGLLGLGLGWLMGVGLNNAHLTYTPPEMNEPVPFGVQLSLGAAFFHFLTALLSTLTSTLYPAWRAARISIVEALHHV
ncbi:MAG: FtsX-like permease family protein [Bacillota bacterium]|nr:FtsX-like permease family protein [Bacillota bacterium]